MKRPPEYKTHDLHENVTSRFDLDRNKLVLEVDLGGKVITRTDDGMYNVFVSVGTDTEIKDVPNVKLRLWCAYSTLRA